MLLPDFWVTMKIKIFKLAQKSILMAFITTVFLQPSFARSTDKSFLPSITTTITAAIGNANLSGFTSIPLGGALGTASLERPTLAEIGINRTTFYDVGLYLTMPVIRIYGNYEYLQPNGSGVLSHNLLFHGLLFPANTRINFATKFDLYNAGIDYPWYCSDKLSIAPAVEFAAVDFSFLVNSGLVQSARSFVQGTGRIGLHARYDFTHALSLSMNAATSIPSLTNLEVVNLLAKINYNFIQYPHVNAGLFASIAYQKICFRDHQTLPNNIRLTMAPMEAVGVVVSF